MRIDMLKKHLEKTLEHIVSWKFQLLVLSTWLFVRGTLDEMGWLMMAASTTGLRELTNLLTLRMGVQEDQCKHPKVDSPDAN